MKCINYTIQVYNIFIIYLYTKKIRRNFHPCHFEKNYILCLVVFGSFIFINIIFFKVKYIVSYGNIPDECNGTIQFNFQFFSHRDIIVFYNTHIVCIQL